MELWNSNASFEEAKEKKLYSAELVRTPRLSHMLAWWCGGIFLVVALSLLLPWTQNIRSSGRLTTLDPEDRPQTVHATIAGRIEKWYVQEGQKVSRGDTILFLSEIKDKYFDPALLPRLNEQIESKEGAIHATMEKAQALKNQIVALQASLEFSLSKARNKVEQMHLKLASDSMDLTAAKMEHEVAKEQFERQQKLYEQGLKSLTELEQRKLKLQETSAKLLSAQNKVGATRNELANSQIELNSLKAEYADKISKAQSELNNTYTYMHNAEGDLSKMNSEYASTAVRSSFYYITAPQDGFIVKALKQGIGETTKEGEPVVSIIASNPPLAVELYVKPMDVTLLSKGSKVRLQFDGWPALVFSGWPGVSFGTFGGVVAVIDNVDSDGKYRILVTPDPNEEPWPEPLRVGSGAYGWAMLNDVPIWYELWRQLNGFPPDYIQENFAPDPNEEKDKSRKI